MADFLSRLAERTLGLAPTVQPVLTPLFAPDPMPGADRISARDTLTTSSVALSDRSQTADETRQTHSQAHPEDLTQVRHTATSRPPATHQFQRTLPGSQPPSHHIGESPLVEPLPAGRTEPVTPQLVSEEPGTLAATAFPSIPHHENREIPSTEMPSLDTHIDSSIDAIDAKERPASPTTRRQLSREFHDGIRSLDMHAMPLPQQLQATTANTPMTPVISASPMKAARKSVGPPTTQSVTSTTGLTDTTLMHQPQRSRTEIASTPITEQPQVKSANSVQESIVAVESIGPVPATSRLMGENVRTQQPTVVGQEGLLVVEEQVETAPNVLPERTPPAMTTHTHRNELVPVSKRQVVPHRMQSPTTRGEASPPGQLEAPFPAAQTRATTPEASGAAPTIRVTIGRIEVQAMTPPAPPPPRHARPGPSLSLEDYLKQYNGRQR